MATTFSNNLPNSIKKLFLRFFQAYFSNHKELTWNYDISKTKIVIVDRHAFDIGTAIKRPTIVINRGDISWTFTTRGQNGINAVRSKDHIDSLAGSSQTSSTGNRPKYTDLIRASINFHVLAKNGILAEHIADVIFSSLTAYKNELRAEGIYQVIGMNLGSEQIIKQNAEPEVIGVVISIAFLMQHTIIKDEKIFNVALENAGTALYEGLELDYIVTENGTTIVFNTTPEAGEKKISYIDAITLEEIEGAVLEATDDPKVFKVPGGAAILGYYKVVQAININYTVDSPFNALVLTNIDEVLENETEDLILINQDTAVSEVNTALGDEITALYDNNGDVITLD